MTKGEIEQAKKLFKTYCKDIYITNKGYCSNLEQISKNATDPIDDYRWLTYNDLLYLQLKTIIRAGYGYTNWCRQITPMNMHLCKFVNRVRN